MGTNLAEALANIDELARLEKYQQALEQLGALAKQYPGNAWIWRSRAYIASRQGNTSVAISEISFAIELQDTEPDFYYTRGILQFQNGAFKACISDFTNVLKLCDVHSSNYYREGAFFFRADAYSRLGEFDKARADCLFVKDGMQTWTDGLRSKDDILKECSQSLAMSRK